MRIWSFRGIYGNRGNGMEQATSDEAKGALYIKKRLVTSLRREVRPMGDGRWAKALRFLVCFIIVLAIMIHISPIVR